MKPLITVSLALVFANCVLAVEPLPDAENVCERFENVKKERLVEKPITYEVVVNDICGFLPCKKTVIHRTIDKSRENYYVEVKRLECCEGYAVTPERTCAPICLKPCNFGKCVEPNRCECLPAPASNHPGYAGPQCNRFICATEDRWGPQCNMTCQCPDTAFCDARTGKCSCRPGWRGTNCTEECDQRSGCDDLPYVVPLFESVNIIKSEDLTGRMSASLVAEPPAVRDSSDYNDDKKAFSRMLMAHLQINMFLIILASGLIFALIFYKKKLGQLKNELYYGSYPDSSSSSVYSTVHRGGAGSIRSRPPMPLPGAAVTTQLAKNMSFDLATRNALSPPKQADQSVNYLYLPINSKTERHLAMSREAAQSNIYSDIKSNQESPRGGLPATVPRNQLSIVQPENEYQVPRSPAGRSSNETNSHANLYEELVPNPSPAKAEDQK